MKKQTKVKKALFFIVAMAIMTFIAGKANIYADDVYVSNDFLFKINNDGTVSITKYVGNEEDVVIPENIDGKKVTSIEDNAFREHNNLRYIEFPDSLLSIGNYAFAGCFNPEAPAEGGEEDPINIVIPSSVNHIGKGAFMGCYSLRGVKMPDGIASIEDDTFFDSGLTSISIPEGVTIIGVSAFEFCRNMTGTLILPSTVKNIKMCAFSDCVSLTGSLNIPNGVEKIESEAFSGCYGLSSLSIPQSVENIENYAFSGCSGLNRITVAGNNSKYASKINDVELNGIFIKDGTILYAGCSKTDIPNGVKEIDDGAFNFCESLKKITIPSSITRIGSSAFYSSGLTGDLVIPNGVKEIDDGAFGHCENLTSINIPASLESIGDHIFDGCGNITSIIIDSNNSEFTSNVADKECNGVFSKDGSQLLIGCMNTNIPEGVTKIDKYAFAGCNGLTSIEIPSSMRIIGDSAFYNCRALKSITIPSGVEIIEGRIILNCTRLTKVVNDSFQIVELPGNGWKDMNTGEIITSIAYGTAIREIENTEDSVPNENEENEKNVNDENNKISESKITVSNNMSSDYSFDSRGTFSIGYYHSVPFSGKSKLSIANFGDITVSYNNVEYKVTKVKVNKKKHLFQITGLQGADKQTVKAIKKATKGASGLIFTVNPYYVDSSDKVSVKTKKDGSIKTVKISISGKDYKAKKTEWSYDSGTRVISFKGNNLTGSYVCD